MKWEDYERLKPVKSYDWESKTQVNVECPQCGKKIWRKNDSGVVLTVYPPIYKYAYECECGWSGLADI